jgi:hypothetical protein
MGILDQKVSLKWTGKIKKHYEERGYVYTKIGDAFMVSVEDLTNKSTANVKVSCDECGLEFVRKYYSITNSFSKGKYSIHCSDCERKYSSKQLRVSFKEIENEFIQRDYKLLSKEDEYINNKAKLDYICLKHNDKVQSISWSNFHSHKKGCRYCKTEKLSEIFKFKDFDKIKSDFKSCGFILLSTDYINNRTPLKCKCITCGEISYKDYSHIKTHLQTGQYAGCIYCFKENNKGENHPSWNPNLSNVDRIINRDYMEYEIWRQKVFERDNYICQCCGISKGLNAHHKDGYHWCEERRVDVLNGVTLCEECHKDFHNKYGLRNNTEQQFNEWIINKNQESA